jgi:hypothetical protein
MDMLDLYSVTLSVAQELVCSDENLPMIYTGRPHHWILVPVTCCMSTVRICVFVLMYFMYSFHALVTCTQECVSCNLIKMFADQAQSRNTHTCTYAVIKEFLCIGSKEPCVVIVGPRLNYSLALIVKQHINFVVFSPGKNQHRTLQPVR